ncbi:ABC transporter permease [Aestuariibacter salexigens]|uniref:ABC transporter permease n=1 Tax=Aestuariibacter salexigens TaxID=226010 RepID=UPI00040F5447|nr:ABC transporter permease [Aestuariibacter salexigens]
MIRYALRYLNLMVLTLLVLSVVSFALAYWFPGDPLTNLSGIQEATPQTERFLAEKYATEHNLFVQYWHYMQLVFSGDWGVSFSSGLPLYDEITLALPATLELCAYAFLLSLIVGIPLGFIAGLKHYTGTDYTVLSLSVFSYSIPAFWLALILILIFCLQLGWLPLSGRINLLFDVPHQTGFIVIDILLSDIQNKSAALNDAFRHLVLPTISIALINTAITVRLARRSIIDVMSKGYIIAARSRGLTNNQILWKHGVRNTLLPILPLIAAQITTLITNAMVIETIFSWPGIGNWLIQAIYQRDYPAIRAGMLAVSSFVVILTVSIELITRLLDPTRDKNERGTI